MNLILFNCTNLDTLITKDKIGDFRIGGKVINEYDKSSLKIELNVDKSIRQIIVSNPIYKTKEGFGVDSELEDIANRFNVKINEDFTAKKGQKSIIDLGKLIVADNILFMDSNRDNKVDAVLISERN